MLQRAAEARLLLAFFALVFGASVVSAAWGGGLTWDGAYYFYKVLDDHAPFVANGRQINRLLQIPALLATTVTASVPLLRWSFALPYTLVPAIGLVCSWLVVRRRAPALFVWPALAVCLALLPGTFFYVSEAQMMGSLFWPLLLAALVGVGGVGIAGLAVLAGVLWWTHPLFVPLMLLVAGAGVLRAGVTGSHRSTMLPPLLAASALVVLVVLKALEPLSDYEARGLSLQRLLDSFDVAVRGWPLLSISCTGTAAVVILWVGARASRGASVALPVLVAAASLVLLPWARNTYTWAHSLDYRFWVGPISLVLGGMAVLDWMRLRQISQLRSGLGAPRSAAVLAAGAGMFLVLTLQVRAWGHELAQLRDALDGAPACVELHALPWIGGHPMEHWATTPLSLVLQGRSPRVLVAESKTGCDDLAAGHFVQLADWDRRAFGRGWFDLRDLRGLPAR